MNMHARHAKQNELPSINKSKLNKLSVLSGDKTGLSPFSIDNKELFIENCIIPC
jgi:hypothetical protein